MSKLLKNILIFIGVDLAAGTFLLPFGYLLIPFFIAEPFNIPFITYGGVTVVFALLLLITILLKENSKATKAKKSFRLS